MSDPAASHRDLALAFLERFCAGDVEGLAPLLAPDFEFRGPLLECDSAAAYLEDLRRDPPQTGCTCRIVDLSEGDGTVMVSWEYRKPTGSVFIDQQFRFQDGRITAVRLGFDQGSQ